MSREHTKAGAPPLSHFKRSMRAYNARRKFKASIMTVKMMNMLGKNAAELNQPLKVGEGIPESR